MRQGPGSHRGAASDKKKKHRKEPRSQEQLTDLLRNYIVELKEKRTEKDEQRYLYLKIATLMTQFKAKEGEIKKSLLTLYQEHLIRKEHRGSVFVPEERVKKEEVELKKFFNYTECPVCDKKMTVVTSDEPRKAWSGQIIKGTSYRIKCESKCFDYSAGLDYQVVSVFDKKFKASMNNKGEVDYIMNEIPKEIKFWTKNYRYVLKLLEKD